MPLYDCMLLLKPHIKKEALMELAIKVGKHVCGRNGVLTNVKYFGTVQLGYGIKKLDGRYFQGQMMQMTMMTPPNFNNELHYLNKEDRLLRWLLVKNRGDLQLDSSDRYEPSRTLVYQDFKGDEKEDSDDEDTDDTDDKYNKGSLF